MATWNSYRYMSASMKIQLLNMRFLYFGFQQSNLKIFSLMQAMLEFTVNVYFLTPFWIPTLEDPWEVVL
jgi:hypothetical protein